MFKVNDFVHWDDPDRGLSSGIYVIIGIFPEDEEQDEDTIFTLRNIHGGLAEVLIHEIRKIEAVNLEVDYMYRDGNNFKQYSSFVLSGVPDDLGILMGRTSLPSWKLDESEYFIPGEVGLEDLQNKFTHASPGADHPWHTFDGWRLTEKIPTVAMSWEEFDQRMSEIDWGDPKLESYKW